MRSKVQKKSIYALFLVVLIMLSVLGCQISSAGVQLPSIREVVQSITEKLPFGSKLDKETLDQLSIGWPGDQQITPGATRQLELGMMECCYVFTPVQARAAWRVDEAEGVTIDQDGVLRVDESTPAGTVFTVYVDVERGRRTVSTTFYVYSEETNPLVGMWREQTLIRCEDGSEIVPADPIGELVFKANGEFQVTWYPFEVYHDYWGAYSFDLLSGNLELQVTGGNYIPDDFDGSGTFKIEEDGSLILQGLWLGSYMESAEPAGCGHHFR